MKWVTEVDKKMLDKQIIEFAREGQRIVFTNDKDFGELTFLRGESSVGILLLRVKEQDVNEKILLLEKLLEQYPDKK